MNHKRVYRVYRAAGLSVRRKARKRLVRAGLPKAALTAANQEWSLDFAADGLATGRALRVLSVMDNFTRECLALEVDTWFASARVTRVLERIVEQRGAPRWLRSDKSTLGSGPATAAISRRPGCHVSERAASPLPLFSLLIPVSFILASQTVNFDKHCTEDIRRVPL